MSLCDQGQAEIMQFHFRGCLINMGGRYFLPIATIERPCTFCYVFGLIQEYMGITTYVAMAMGDKHIVDFCLFAMVFTCTVAALLEYTSLY